LKQLRYCVANVAYDHLTDEWNLLEQAERSVPGVSGQVLHFLEIDNF
jgi:hypothetical protein